MSRLQTASGVSSETEARTAVVPCAAHQQVLTFEVCPAVSSYRQSSAQARVCREPQRNQVVSVGFSHVVYDCHKSFILHEDLGCPDWALKSGTTTTKQDV